MEDKKPYRKPTAVVLGDVKTLTLATLGSVPPGNSGNANNG